MSTPNPLAIASHFDSLADPRLSSKTEHKLLDIIVIAICGVICHADGWVSIAELGRAKEGWFRQFLELPNGIPSHDTFNKVLTAFETAEEADFQGYTVDSCRPKKKAMVARRFAATVCRPPRACSKRRVGPS